MRRTTRRMRAGAVGMGLLLAAGCGPIAFGTGSGMGLASGPRPALSLDGCALGSGSLFGAGVGLTTASIRLGTVKNRIAKIQSSHAPGYNSYQARRGRMKSLATGECR